MSDADISSTEREESLRRLAELVLELGSEQPVGQPRKREAARSFARTQILIHAMSVFNRRGLEETSVQDLLDAATISRRTFYKYFTGTLDVLVDEATWAARPVAPYTAPPATGFGRELFTNFRRHAGGAEQGACTWL